MPPAAPAKEWIVESPGIVESCNGDEGDGKHGCGGSFAHHPNINKHVTSFHDDGCSIESGRNLVGTNSAERGRTILQSNYNGGCTMTRSSSRRHNGEYCEDAFLGERAESYPYLRQCLRKTQSVNRVSLCDPTSCRGRTDRCSEVKHGSSSNQRFLVVILDVNVYYVYRFVELAPAVKQIWSTMSEVIF